MAHTASALADVAAAKSMIDQLFARCDIDGNGFLGFPEVASLFKQLAPDQSTRSACNAAVEALLMVDRNADSRLDRAEFEQLLMKVSDTSGVPLPEAASKLLVSISQQPLTTAEASSVQAASSGAPTGILHQANTCHAGETAAASEQVATTPGVAEAVTETGLGSNAVEQNAKLQALFDQWDKNKDGRVNFSELCQGLAKFKRVSCKQDVASLLSESSSVLAVHDTDADWQLDVHEFCSFISAYMSAAGYQLSDVLDELILIAATKRDSAKLQRVLDSALPQIDRALSGKQ